MGHPCVSQRGPKCEIKGKYSEFTIGRGWLCPLRNSFSTHLDPCVSVLVSGFKRSQWFINGDINKVVCRSSARAAPSSQDGSFWFAPRHGEVLPFCWRSFGLIRCQRNTLATRPLHRDPFAPEFPRQSSVISCLPLLRVCYPFQLKCSCSHAAERGGELQTDREGGWVGDQTPEQSALTREVYFRRLFDFFFSRPAPPLLETSTCSKPFSPHI